MPATLTLHNLQPWAESFELTPECASQSLPGVQMRTPKSVKAPDGTTGFAWEDKLHAPTITIPARGKLSSIPLAAREAPSVKAAVAAGTLRISEDGSASPAPHKRSKSAGENK